MNLSGGARPERIDYREDWDQAMSIYLQELQADKSFRLGSSVVW